jgi:methylated-DNA-[protein]-cysteine S-methyltransferase
MFYSTTLPSPFGTLTLASDQSGTHLIGLWLEGQRYHSASIPEPHADNLTPNPDLPLFTAVNHWLDQYFSGNNPPIHTLPLAPIGTEFRRELWHLLSEIPYGKTVTYGDLARKMALKMNKRTMSGQAIGGAVGHNPISIIIPCHRVIGSDGSLTGYAGGIEVKAALLSLEQTTDGALGMRTDAQRTPALCATTPMRTTL